jgi:large subunit ribosomal protein L21
VAGNPLCPPSVEFKGEWYHAPLSVSKRIPAVSKKYAIVNVFGRQIKVSEGDVIQAAFTNSEIGTKLTFDNVVLSSDGAGSTKVGSPYLAGAKVTATVKEQVKAKKVLVFKYLNKNKLKKMRGHRQPYTMLTVDSVSF